MGMVYVSGIEGGRVWPIYRKRACHGGKGGA